MAERRAPGWWSGLVIWAAAATVTPWWILVFTLTGDLRPRPHELLPWGLVIALQGLLAGMALRWWHG